MHSSKPDFKTYSQDELRDALENIDKTQFPDRVKEIESLLVESPSKNSSQKRVKKEWTPKTQFWFCLFGSMFMIFCIIDGAHTGYMIGRKGGADLDSDPIGYYVLLVTYLLFLVFCVHGIFQSRKRARKLKHGDT